VAEIKAARVVVTLISGRLHLLAPDASTLPYMQNSGKITLSLDRLGRDIAWLATA